MKLNINSLNSRMGIRSGHSSVRTISESSNTDKAAKQEVSETTDKRTGNVEESPYNSERRGISNTNRRNSKSRYVKPIFYTFQKNPTLLF